MALPIEVGRLKSWGLVGGEILDWNEGLDGNIICKRLIFIAMVEYTEWYLVSFLGSVGGSHPGLFGGLQTSLKPSLCPCWDFDLMISKDRCPAVGSQNMGFTSNLINILIRQDHHELWQLWDGTSLPISRRPLRKAIDFLSLGCMKLRSFSIEELTPSLRMVSSVHGVRTSDRSRKARDESGLPEGTHLIGCIQLRLSIEMKFLGYWRLHKHAQNVGKLTKVIGRSVSFHWTKLAQSS